MREAPVRMARTEPSLALFTAFYELTMSQAYWESGQTADATFSLFMRRLPPNRGYLVFAGLPEALEYLEGFHFTDDDISYLESFQQFNPRFLDYLRGVRFTGSVRAMREGTLFFPNEPVLEVTAPIIEAQIAENFLLNQTNLPSMLATKASRIVSAARGRPVMEFGSRRAHGLDAADRLARVSYMVGFAGTGNVRAAARYGVPPGGTMAHSFVTSFPKEADAFRAYGRSFPASSTFVVDSYDSIEGTRNAIRVAREMREQGHELRAIRLDSGDLIALSRQCRALLSEAGFPGVRILASGDLGELEIEELLLAGAPIDGFGIGTKVATSSDAAWTDCVYKLVEYDKNPVLKLSAGKETLPGPKQVHRHADESGAYMHDVLGLVDETPPAGGIPLLEEVMRGGKRVKALPSLGEARTRFAEEFAHLPQDYKALRHPAHYPVVLSLGLRRLQHHVTRQVKERALGD